jgi:hypothetical protein
MSRGCYVIFIEGVALPMTRDIICILLMFCTFYPQLLLAGEDQCTNSELALLDQNLAIVNNLLKIRHDLIIKSATDPSLKAIIDNIDGSLMLNISITTLKDAFNKAYADKLAANLYKKNAITIMKEFCNYTPKNIALYRDAMNVIIADCKNFNCEKCELGLDK